MACPCKHAVEQAPVCVKCAANRAKVSAWQRTRLRKARKKYKRYNKTAKGKIRHRRHHQERGSAVRALRRGALSTDVTVTLRGVYARDDGICALCGYDVPHPDAEGVTTAQRASIDHVQPVSLGGAHSWDNVRLAHVGCNARRGARPDQAAAEGEEIPF